MTVPERPKTLLWLSVGEPAFAAVTLVAVLGAAHVVASRLTPLDPPTGRWIREILSGFLVDHVMSGGIALSALLKRPLGWGIVALLAALRWRFRGVGAVRAAPHVAAAALVLFGSVGVTLYANVLNPAATLALEWALLALVAARAAWGSRQSRWPGASTLRRAGAPALVTVHGVLIIAAVAASAQRGRELVRGSSPFSPEPAYDVVIAGDPPVLAFTDQRRLRLLRDPYGAPGAAPETLVEGIDCERLIPAEEAGAFYLAASSHGVRRISLVGEPRIVPFVSEASHWAAALAEDPQRRRLWVLNEWFGTGAVFSLDAPEKVRRLEITDRTWPVPWVTADVPARRAYLTSMLADGELRVLDLDSFAVVAERAGVFAYQSVVDRERGLLWATRPMPGEIVGFDRTTLAVRARVPLAPGTRDVALDARRGQLFVNTYPYGELFRIDASTGQVLEVGGCGWRCRSLYLDEARRTLWSASLGGVYRFPVDGALRASP